jgi:hypothetical protein
MTLGRDSGPIEHEDAYNQAGGAHQQLREDGPDEAEARALTQRAPSRWDLVEDRSSIRRTTPDTSPKRDVVSMALDFTEARVGTHAVPRDPARRTGQLAGHGFDLTADRRGRPASRGASQSVERWSASSQSRIAPRP